MSTICPLTLWCRMGLCLLSLSLVVASTTSQATSLFAQQTFSQRAPLTTPFQPLLGWRIAPDGALFVVDARHVLYELDPQTLAPLRQTDLLAAAAASVPTMDAPLSDQRVYLAATADELWVGSALLNATLRLRRRDLRPFAQLDPFGPLAVAPDEHLFLVHDGALWVYDLQALTTPPTALIPPWTAQQFSGERALDLALNPVTQMLYVTTYGAFGSSPHNPELLHRFDLGTLEEVGVDDYLGHLLPPTVAQRDGAMAMLFQAKSGLLGSRLFIWTGDGRRKQALGPLSGLAHVLSSDGNRLYLVRERGLWLLDGHTGALISVLPFLQPPPTALLLSPDDELLYLFGNGWHSVMATAQLATWGIAPLAGFPRFWQTEGDQGYDRSYRQYTSSSTAAFQASVPITPTVQPLFTILGGELYHTTDGGRSWRFDPTFTYPNFRPLAQLSLSPEFATDHTVVAHSPLAQTLFRSTDGGQTWAAWSPRIAFTADHNGNRDLYVADYRVSEDNDMPPIGTPRPLTDNPADDENPAWSPSWTRIVFQSNRTGNWDLFSIRADCELATPNSCNLRQLTNDPADDLLPAWSPDGATIAFVSLRDGNAEIYRMNADGSDQQRITDHPNGDWRPAWQPDGTLLFTSDRNGNNDIYQVSLNTQLVGAEPLLTPLIATAADERDVAVNSRGDLLFRSDHDGSDRVYRVSADRLERSSSPYTNEPLDPYAYAYDKAALPSGHPAWVTVGGEELILLATDEENSGIIYQLPAYTLANAEGYQSIGEHLGFAGQPAGGPTWWAGETVR